MERFTHYTLRASENLLKYTVWTSTIRQPAMTAADFVLSLIDSSIITFFINVILKLIKKSVAKTCIGLRMSFCVFTRDIFFL